MRKFFFILAISFGILLLVNAVWAVTTLYLAVTYSIEYVSHGNTLIESLDTSVYLKWILLVDGVWIFFAAIYMVNRRRYKTDSNLHYLRYEPITNPSICVIIPAHNEEKSIEKVVTEYSKQKYVDHVIVIDDNSTDSTGNIAEKCGAKVIRKKGNKGYPHSYVMGLREALNTTANVIVTTEADGTYNAYDLAKMLPYLDNCDMVIGTRQVQVLTAENNQNRMIHTWGNLLVAKLIQVKYFSLRHLGIVNLTDVGCLFRFIKRDALEKISNKLTYPNTDKVVGGIAIALYLTMLAIENDLRIVEIPVTFNKRVGSSKLQSNQTIKGIRYGLQFIWFVLIS